MGKAVGTAAIREATRFHNRQSDSLRIPPAEQMQAAELFATGWHISEIAKHMNRAHKTITKWLNTPDFYASLQLHRAAVAFEAEQLVLGGFVGAVRYLVDGVADESRPHRERRRCAEKVVELHRELRITKGAAMALVKATRGAR